MKPIDMIKLLTRGPFFIVAEMKSIFIKAIDVCNKFIVMQMQQMNYIFFME